MRGAGSSDALVERLLEPSLRYATRAAAIVPPGTSNLPTPCRRWDVGEVARHLLESLRIVTTSLDLGITPPPPGRLGRPDDLAGFEERLDAAARDLLAAARRRRRTSTSVEGVDLDSRFVLIVASVEASVHSWDLLAGAGTPRPVPEPLARNLRRVLPEVVGAATRGTQFAAPVPVSEHASSRAARRSPARESSSSPTTSTWPTSAVRSPESS